MKPAETLMLHKKNLLVFLSVLVFSMAARNFFLLSKDMINGDFSAEKVFPQPMHGLYRIPDRPNTIEHNAVNRLAADFAQVYFPSQDFSSLSNNYQTGNLDPWWRPSRYAPAVHYLCSITICKLNYGFASFLHILIQIVLFYIFFIISFKLLDVRSYTWAGVLLVTFFLFVTPAGLSFIERGQFSLYVALGSLLLITGLSKNNIYLIIASALFAYIKWTSLPFLFVVMAVYWLSARSLKTTIRNTQMALAYLLIIVVLSLAFRSRFLHFLEGIFWQELNALPEGISISHLLPAKLVKWIPLVLILVGGLYVRKHPQGGASIMPFFIGAGVLMTTYPTVAHEYNIPGIYCFIPLVFYGAKELTPGNKITKYAFLIFIVLASFASYFRPSVNETVTLVIYLVVSVLILSSPLISKFAHWN